MHINSDIVRAICLELQDTRLQNSFPLWWVPYDKDLHESVQLLASLALVSQVWVEPSRKVLVRAIPLLLGARQARSFTRLLDNRQYAGPLVRTLVIAFSFRNKRLSDFVTCNRLHHTVSLCPMLQALHLDNVPHTMAQQAFLDDLASLPCSELITTFGFRVAEADIALSHPYDKRCLSKPFKVGSGRSRC